MGTVWSCALFAVVFKDVSYKQPRNLQIGDTLLMHICLVYLTNHNNILSRGNWNTKFLSTCRFFVDLYSASTSYASLYSLSVLIFPSCVIPVSKWKFSEIHPLSPLVKGGQPTLNQLSPTFTKTFKPLSSDWEDIFKPTPEPSGGWKVFLFSAFTWTEV